MRETNDAHFKFQAEKDKPDSGIKAEEILEAVRAGKSVEIRGATIHGPLSLKHKVVQGTIVIENCDIADELDAVHTVFERSVDFSKTRFHGTVNFTLATFKDYVTFDKAKFKKMADFSEVVVEGIWSSKGKTTTYHGPVSFAKATLKKAADFQESIFENVAFFMGIEVSWGADFNNAVFQAGVTFRWAKIGLGMILSGVKVWGETGCADLKVEGYLVGLDAQFRNRKDCDGNLEKDKEAKLSGFEPLDYQGHVDFSNLSVGQDLNFRNAHFLGSKQDRPLTPTGRQQLLEGKEPTECERVSAMYNKFDSISVGGKVTFTGAQFTDWVGFGSVVFHSDAWFGGLPDEPEKVVSFESGADFSQARFEAHAGFIVDSKGDLGFRAAEFRRQMYFIGKCRGVLYFTNARFWGQVVFKETSVEKYISFRAATLLDELRFESDKTDLGWVTFQNARLQSIEITLRRDKDKGNIAALPFRGKIDLRGCTYQQISCADGLEKFWELLSPRLREQALDKKFDYDFEVQPYTQLEKVCRNEGANKLGDAIYYERRKMNSNFEKRLIFKAWDRFERYVFGYGVKPEWMIGWFIVLWILGAVVFSFPQAMKPTSPVGSGALPSLYYALFTSLGNLIPGKSYFTSTYWAPNLDNLPVMIWAIFQHLAGWVLLALLARRFFAGLQT